MLSQIAQQAAPLIYKEVGDSLLGKPTEVKVAAHALVGGVISKLIGGDFGSGAAGSAAAELAVENFGKDIDKIQGLSKEDKNALTMLVGQVVGKVVAQAAGASNTASNAAADTAKLAIENNFLKHNQLDQFKKRYDQCKDQACKDQVLKDMKVLSDAQDALLKQCTTKEQCQALVADYVNPIQQDGGFMGIGVTEKDVYNFCASGDQACLQTLRQIAASSNGAMMYSTTPEIFADENAKRVAKEKAAKDFQDRGMSPDMAKMLVDMLDPLAASTLGGALGATVGASRAGAAFWSSTGSKSSVENAYEHWDKHKSKF